MRQPWLDGDGTAPTGRPDLFSRASLVVPAHRVGVALALAVLVLIAGTTAEQAKAVLDLPLWPGTDHLIGLVEALDGAARETGLARPHAWLRALARRLEGADEGY